MREVRKERRQNLKSVVVVLFMEAKKIKKNKKVPNNRFLQSGSIHRSTADKMPTAGPRISER